jgi:hypothetical protein
MKKLALGLVLAGVASLAACKSPQQTYRPAPNYTGPTTTGPTYTGPSTGPTYTGPTYTPPPPAYPQPGPAPAPRTACGGGKCG